MAFRYPFISIPTSAPVVSLGGRLAWPRPIIPIVAINPRNLVWRQFRGTIDTAADDTVFHEKTARLLGIDLTNAPVGQAEGTTGVAISVKYADIFLQLISPDGEVVEWRATVAFAEKKTSNPLLGFAGFLQFFDATCWGGFEEVELVPNHLFPGQPPSIVVS